ncbi:MAG: Spy/CpxP family protein refolding chaperone [candidate division NC10 bacterium]|nr:Spy/CpxP family protein refolding chaperone [candidate division NC10 bacterium]
MQHAVACLLVVSLALFAAPAPAQHGPGEGGMMGGGMMRGMGGDRAPGHEGPLISLMLQMKDQLGLSLKQVQVLRDLRAAFEKEAIQRGAEIRVAEVDLREALAQEQVDLGRAEALVRKIAGLRAESRLSRIRTLEKGKGVLTPEQLAKFREAGHQMARGGMGGGHMGPGMMGPGGPGGVGGRPGQY